MIINLSLETARISPRSLFMYFGKKKYCCSIESGGTLRVNRVGGSMRFNAAIKQTIEGARPWRALQQEKVLGLYVKQNTK